MNRSSTFVIATTLCFTSLILADEKPPTETPAVLDFKVKDIDGREVFLGDYQGSVLLVVNVASKCGYTPQYEQLEALHRQFKDQGFKILAFPSNDFGQQEPGSNKDIKAFCKTKYDVTFDLFAKVSVKGEACCDFYRYLTDESKTGKLGGDIRWNFTKFLIDRDGNVVSRFEPGDNPMGKKVIDAVKAAVEHAKTDTKAGVSG